MNEVIDALKFLFQSGVINEVQFQDYFNRCNGSNVDFEGLKLELKKIYDDYQSRSGNDSNSFDFDIIDVDDGENAMYTGVYPINTFIDNLNEYEEIDDGNSLGIQKTLGSHPGTGKHFHWGEDSGFMAFLLVIFLAGISSGIIFMIILNFLAK